MHMRYYQPRPRVLSAALLLEIANNNMQTLEKLLDRHPFYQEDYEEAEALVLGLRWELGPQLNGKELNHDEQELRAGMFLKLNSACINMANIIQGAVLVPRPEKRCCIA